MHMKNKFCTYTSKQDVNEINCDLNGATLIITPSLDEVLTVTFPDAKNLSVANDKTAVYIKQSRKPLFCREQTIKLSVPTHTVPALNLSGKSFFVQTEGGIFGAFNILAESCKVQLAGSSFENVEIICSGGYLSFSGITVKNTLVVKCREGEIAAENTFAACAELRVKNGNIGLSAFNCKDSVLEVQNGNIAAELDGGERDYNLNVLAKEGISNRESVQNEGASKIFKAYLSSGNLAINFTQSNEKFGDEEK